MFPLSADTWAAIHNGMAEAHALIGNPVTFVKKNTAQAVDPLYNEATATTDYLAYATVNASVRHGNRFGPDVEYQTKQGLYAGDEIWVWIPQGVVAAWEAGPPPRTFTIDEKDYRVDVNGKRYNIIGVTDDRWGQETPQNVGGSMDTTRLGILVRAKELPR